jgi:hypothetical protein
VNYGFINGVKNLLEELDMVMEANMGIRRFKKLHVLPVNGSKVHKRRGFLAEKKEMSK